MLKTILALVVLTVSQSPSPDVSACAQGDGTACARLPTYALEGYGLLEAVLRQCSETTNGASCMSAGLAISERNPVHANALLERSCELGFEPGCAELIRRLSMGSVNNPETPRDLTRALALLGGHCAEVVHRSPCDSLRTQPLWNVPSIHRARVDCAKGSADACLALGRTFSGGPGVSLSEADWQEAAASLQRSCEVEDPRGCYELGELLQAGQGQPKDLDRARAAFARACDAGSSDGCERHELLDLPLKGCNDGDGMACAELARSYSASPGHRRDRDRAGELWERACDLTASACRDAGDAYRLGVGVSPDLDRALAYYNRAGERDVTRRFEEAARGCKKGLPQACVRLGDLYFGDPAGTPLQADAAREHYERGCELMGGEACMRLVDRYSVDQDGRPNASAVRYAKAACDASDGAGCTVWGNLITGKVVDAPESAVREAYQKACDRGDGEGCYRLGLALQRDPNRADASIALLQRACSLSYTAACDTP